MPFELWSFMDSNLIEKIVNDNHLNTIKIHLFSQTEGYNVSMILNGETELMNFSYEDCTILDSLDYGVLPTTLFSAICQAQEDYLYRDYVIVEIRDRRPFRRSTASSVSIAESDVRRFTVLRITDNVLVKLTGSQARAGQWEEEQQIIGRRFTNMSLRYDQLTANAGSSNEDPYGFIDSNWFQQNAGRHHVSNVVKTKRLLSWEEDIDGHFRLDDDYDVSEKEDSKSDRKKDNSAKVNRHRGIRTRRLKRFMKNNLCIDKNIVKKQFCEERKMEADSNFSEMINILELQKQSIFNLPRPPLPTQYEECHEECVHKMVIRSPQSGCHFRVSVHRCGLHNRHWGVLTVDQWEGCSSGPIQFELPGGHDQARRLLSQLSDMLRARQMSPPASAGATGAATPGGSGAAVVTDAGVVGAATAAASAASAAAVTTAAGGGWMSMETLMTKNIQSGKLLYDNRDTAALLDLPARRRGACHAGGGSGLSATGTTSSANTKQTTEASLSVSSTQVDLGSNDDGAQKQSFFSLKDLNLDDLF